MGLETEAEVIGTMRSAAEDEEEADPMMLPLTEACEALDLDAVAGVVVPDSNGHLTEDEEEEASPVDGGVGGLEDGVEGASGKQQLPVVSSSSQGMMGQEGSLVHTKNWSDFNSVGSFSDFLTEFVVEPDLPEPEKQQLKKEGSLLHHHHHPQEISDVDFFEWHTDPPQQDGGGDEFVGLSGTETPGDGGGMGIAGIGVQQEFPQLGVVVAAPQKLEHWNSMAGEEEEARQQSVAIATMAQEKEGQQSQLFEVGAAEQPDVVSQHAEYVEQHVGYVEQHVGYVEQHVGYVEQHVDHVQQHGALGLEDQQQTAPAEEASGIENSYPGWYYDYQVSEWRQVEGGVEAANTAGITTQENYAFQNGEPDPSSFAISKNNEVEQVGEDGWASTTGTAQAAIEQQYPGWSWDYQAQMWVQVSSEPWQNSSAPAAQQQQYSGQETFYEQQASWQQQSQSFYPQQELLQQQPQQPQQFQQPQQPQQPQQLQQSQQPQQPLQPQQFQQFQQSFYEQQDNSKQQFQSYNVGYAPSVSNAQQIYANEPKQWQTEQQFMNPVSFPQMNGGQSWGVQPPDGYQGPPVMTQMHPSEMNYNYTSSSHTSNYVQQQPWSNSNNNNNNNAYNHHHQYVERPLQLSSSPPRSVYEAMQTSVGRPPHSLACFGFGGKLMMMKLKDPVTLHTSNGDQAIVSGQAWTPGPVQLQTLNVCTGLSNNRSGPLMGGAMSTKELYKWIDDCISSCLPQDSLRLLWGLLKVACQHYGKLRSLMVSSGISSKEEDGPEAALAKLLAAASGANESAWTMGTSAHSQSLQLLPSEQQLQITAQEMKRLLVAGKQKDALKCAQQGQLWGPALLLACQLGDKFYTETATEMAKAQFMEGSPLRTLCLLLAGQPADVFLGTALPGAMQTMDATKISNLTQMQVGVGAMLEEWQENLAIMAANRTAGDERVILHLGDCLWRARGEVNAAHICYLVADAALESYSQSARLCLIGADHCKNPRTYVTADAIQRTEIFEYAKVLGNPQFVLLPFQPYKLIYASMLAEAGKSAEALRYCQAVLKTLKTAGRSPDMEACRVAAADLEDRLRMHTQDGHGSTLAPGKLVGRFLSTLDRGISRMIGGPPPPTSAVSHGHGIEHGGEQNMTNQVRPGSSHGQRPPVPSDPSGSVAASMELLHKEPKRYMSSRSFSEPDFSKSPKEGKGEGIPGSPSRAASGGYHLGRFGSSILQKAVGLVSFTSHTPKAKLGDTNKFRYDEKLKRWVEEGVELPPEEPLPPPPISSNFIGSTSPETSQVTAPAVSSKPGTPPIPPSSGTHSSRTRSQGVRSRYVDTFNTSGTASALKPVVAPFVPVPTAGKVGAAMPAMFIPTPLPGTALNESRSEFADTMNSSRDEITSKGGYLDTANSYSNSTDTGQLNIATSSMMVPGVPMSDNGFAPSAVDGSVYPSVTSSRTIPPTFSTEAHTRSASWDGYQTSFHPSQFPSEEDSYRASYGVYNEFRGSRYAHPAASVSGSPLTNNMNFFSSSLPSPPPIPPPLGSAEGSGIATAHKDPNGVMLVQTYTSSQGTESLVVDEMQEVEL